MIIIILAHSDDRKSVCETSLLRYARILKVYTRHQYANLDTFTGVLSISQSLITCIEGIANFKSHSIRPVPHRF